MTEKLQLVLLDLMLPGADGIELMEHIPELADLPAIFLSGYRRDETIARALELGAADYVVKLFSPTELTARVQAALRRSAGADAFVLGDLAIDYEGRRVTLAGRVVELTATEYQLLRVLSVRAGRTTTLRDSAAPSVAEAPRRPAAGARRREAGPPQAGRRRDAAHLHHHRATRRLPHAQTGQRGLNPPRGPEVVPPASACLPVGLTVPLGPLPLGPCTPGPEGRTSEEWCNGRKTGASKRHVSHGDHVDDVSSD